MTFSERSLPSAGPRSQLSRLAWLLPALASPLLAAHAPPFVLRPAQAVARQSLPYLAAADPVPMRFAPPLPEPPTEPTLPAAAPPIPGGLHEEIAASNRDAQLPAATLPGADPAPPAEIKPAPDSENPPPTTSSQPRPITLLPDETRREIRPEDVLPLFEAPAGNFILAVPPSPSALPPSSATYRQK